MIKKQKIQITFSSKSVPMIGLNVKESVGALTLNTQFSEFFRKSNITSYHFTQNRLIGIGWAVQPGHVFREKTL